MCKNLAIIILVVSLGCRTASYGQQHLVDSLLKELKQPLPDTTRAISMMRLAIDYEVIDTAKAFKAYKDAIAFASRKKLYYQLGRIYHNQAVLFKVAGRYEDLKASLEKAIESYKKSTQLKARKWEASAWGDIANYYLDKNDPQQAINYNLKSIAIIEEHGFFTEAVTRYYNIANLFSNMREYEKQNEYARKALRAAKISKDAKSLCIAYFTLAISYSLMDKDKIAKTYIDSSRMYFAENWSIDFMFSFYIITAQTFRKLNQLDSAFYYFEKCYKLSEKYNYNFGKAEAQLQMGAVSILQKNYSRAETFLKAGIKEAEAINYYNMLDEGYKYLSDIYAVNGNYKLAYEYFQKYKEINDSVVDMDSRKYATDLEKKYETAKKQSQIQKLEADKKIKELTIHKKNTLNFILIGGIFWVSIISFLIYRNLKHRQKLQQQRIHELETEKKLEATEAVLKGEEQERTRLAKDLHDGLGGMLSGIKYSFTTMKGNMIMTPENQQAFERGLDMLDSSIKEMRRVAHNMMPEALVRFGLDAALKDFCNDINQSGALKVSYQSIGMENIQLEQTVSITIYRIIQELINNTMKHASANSAIVQLQKAGGQITITVEDDGKGFDTGILNVNKGIGWVNIRNRIEFLKGKLDISSKPGEGTSIQIELPNLS
jgi:signal transduction histidine kinase